MTVLFFFYVLSLLLTAVSNSRNLSKSFFFIVLCISTISFFYVPSESADLYRHFANIEFYRDVGFDWILENRMDLNPLTNLLLYAFSFTGEPRLFTSFCTFITYGFNLLLLYRVSKWYSLSKSKIVLLTMFLLFNWNYLLVASNCRIFMLYAIVAYFFYMEFVENRFHKSALIVYLASILFHYGILLVVIPRLLLYLYKPTNKIVYLWALIGLAFFAYNGISNYQTLFLDSVSDRIERYKDYKTFGKWQFLNSLIVVLMCCFYTIKKRFYLKEIKRFSLVFGLIVIPIFLQISNFQVIYRESNLIASLSVVLFSQILSNKNDYIMRQIIGIQSIISLVYSFIYVYPNMDFIFVI